MNKKNSISLFINYFNLVSCLLLVFALLFHSFEIQKYAYFLFFGSYIVEFFIDKKWQAVKINKTTIYFLVYLAFFVLAFIYYPFEESNKYFKLLIEKRYPLLGFSLIGFFGINHLYKLKYFVNVLVFGSLAVIFYLIFIKIGIKAFIEDTNQFNLMRLEHVNSHMIFNFYLNSSILGTWYLLSNNWRSTNPYYKTFLIVSVVLFLGILSISEGRTGFILGVFLSSVVFFIELWKWKKITAIIFTLLLPLIIFSMANMHERMSLDLFKNEPRLFLWESAWHVVKEKPILGYGISTAQVEFDASREIYQTEAYKNEWIKSKHLDSHNQYLQTWMEFGILGLLMLLYIFIAPLNLVHKKRRVLLLFLTLLFSIQAFFDMFVTGPFSAIFCIWIIFMLRTKTKDERLALSNKPETNTL